MSLTLDKLQKLKRQAGGDIAAREPAPTDSSLPRAPLRQERGSGGIPAQTSIDYLRNLLRVRAPAPPLVRVDSDRTLPGIEIADGLHLREAFLPDDVLPESFCGAFDRKDALDPARMLFFDTETTGLAGGTGTRAFMIGVADWYDGALRIRQLTMRTMAAENAMLDVFRTWVSPESILVSYNGKCYDAPLLATRYRLARKVNPLAGLAHVDLLYPTRRRYRGVYENCRLATIERQVLRIVREDDLPGSEAPAAWLSFLRGGSAQNLRRVLAHNHQDVISLSRLLRHLSAQ
jgi:uncharacterized protein YprB with RNaseH-like and TPR domain